MKMSKSELRNKYLQLMHAQTIDDCIAHLNIFLEYLMELVSEHHSISVNNIADAQAKIINQMMFSKALNLRKVLEGIDYKSQISDRELNDIIDPTIVASLVRNIYG